MIRHDESAGGMQVLINKPMKPEDWSIEEHGFTANCGGIGPDQYQELIERGVLNVTTLVEIIVCW